jgi:hypothetical protein
MKQFRPKLTDKNYNGKCFLSILIFRPFCAIKSKNLVKNDQSAVFGQKFVRNARAQNLSKNFFSGRNRVS